MPLRLYAGLPQKAVPRQDSGRALRWLVAARMEPGAQREALPPLHGGGDEDAGAAPERLRDALPHQPEPHTLPDDRGRRPAPLLRALQQPRGDGGKVRTDTPYPRRAARGGAGERTRADCARGVVLRDVRRLSHQLGRVRQRHDAFVRRIANIRRKSRRRDVHTRS